MTHQTTHLSTGTRWIWEAEIERAAWLGGACARNTTLAQLRALADVRPKELSDACSVPASCGSPRDSAWLAMCRGCDLAVACSNPHAMTDALACMGHRRRLHRAILGAENSGFAQADVGLVNTAAAAFRDWLQAAIARKEI